MGIISIRNAIESEEFDYNLLKYVLRGYKNPRLKINDLLKKQYIIRVKKGLYVFGPKLAKGPYSKETLANLIYGPSYISLEYALSFYGLIPERVELVTSVTNKRNKLFQTPVGTFSYRYINPSLYSLGVTSYDLDKKHTILIATKEKALCDVLYFSPRIDDEAQMKEFLFDNLRLDRDEFCLFNLDRIRQLAVLYGYTISLIVNVLEAMQ